MGDWRLKLSKSTLGGEAARRSMQKEKKGQESSLETLRGIKKGEKKHEELPVPRRWKALKELGQKLGRRKPYPGDGFSKRGGKEDKETIESGEEKLESLLGQVISPAP